MRRAVAIILVVALIVAVAAGAITALFSRASDAVQTMMAPVEVPSEYSAVIRKAAKRCPVIPVDVFAAQLAAESGWDHRAVSSAGAQGIAQFMPPVWEQYGIDANDDGKRDVWDPVDAIHSAAELNCINAGLVKGVPGDRVNNILAAYNAGFGSVRKYEGIPPFPETEAYVAKINRMAPEIRWQ